ncbi:MAG: hypothetical protein JWQ32_901 [Marmoricola sp.]|nr:hypothetical protein [Marmoricola sp.]
MPRAQPSARPEQSGVTQPDPVRVDIAFRRAALIQSSKLSLRLRRLSARRRQGAN